MGGALAATIVGYRFVLSRPAPRLDEMFHLPSRRDIDLPLIGGSAVFGMGWGIAGFCPGGAIPALGTGRTEVVVFIAALVAGILTAKFLRRRQRITAPV